MKLTILGSLITAFILAIWGQDMAYFLTDQFVWILPIYYLTALTLISLSLFIIAFILTFYLPRDSKLANKNIVMYQAVILLVGGLTSFWSLFVLIMWWG